MVKSSPVCKWSSIQMVSEYQTKNLVIEWQGCQVTIFIFRFCHSYFVPFEIGTDIQMVEPFEYRTLKSLVFRWIRYKVSSFRMVTVISMSLLHLKTFGVFTLNLFFLSDVGSFEFCSDHLWHDDLCSCSTHWHYRQILNWNLIRISSDKSGLVQPTNYCNEIKS